MAILATIKDAEERLCPACETTFFYKPKSESVVRLPSSTLTVEPDYEFIGGERRSLIDSPYCLACYYVRERLIADQPDIEPSDDDIRIARESEDNVTVIEEDPSESLPPFGARRHQTMKIPSPIDVPKGPSAEEIQEELTRQEMQHLLIEMNWEKAMELRQTAQAAANHVGRVDQFVPDSPPVLRRSCKTCYFGPNHNYPTCSYPLLENTSSPQELTIPLDVADDMYCDGWIYNQLAWWLLDGFVFDAISIKTRNPKTIDPLNGKEKLTALAEKQLRK